MENQFRFLEFKGIQIAAFIESHNNNEHAGYHAQNVLFFVEQGQQNIKIGKKLIVIPAGNFCIVRKFTNVRYYKTWDEGDKYAVVKAMILQDVFVQEAINELGLSKPKKEIRNRVIDLKNNTILKGLYTSLTLYLAENDEPDDNLMFLKTKEALLGILKSNPDYLAVFYEFSKPVKAELSEFIQHHYLLNLPLKSLAKLSGRSLSTFNRDFKKLYQTSPHSWLLKERLKEANRFLVTGNKKASEIYLDLGFKDLGHFSRTFKKEFGTPPSKVFKKQK